MAVTVQQESRDDWEDEHEREVYDQYNALMIEFFGDEAASDNRSLKDRLGLLPIGGAMICPDPGELDPIKHEGAKLSDEEAGAAALAAVKTIRRLFKR